ncbi:MAG: tRNA (guanosine(37)-N1)-methyltransferase TrmD [Elusimicrobia bacterium]|nr:tRNA (guanosine(37)-N1)-methyltransferase TrmD [Elusimicrobiota bacterium]
MKIDILTLFPEFFESPLSCGLMGKAMEKGILKVSAIDIRKFSPDGYVDDKPFGGGSGMVLKVQPIYEAVKSVLTDESEVIVLTPRGERLNQKIVKELSAKKHLILVCGRYEGIDERVNVLFKTRQISVGDFVLSGGEAAAFVLTEAVSRLLPGFVGNPESVNDESFNEDGVAEYPQYTRPKQFMGHNVPDVLLSGNHRKIAEYRNAQKRKVKL